MEDKLTELFMEILPAELKFKSDVYRNYKEFVYDLNRYGGLIQACPKYKFQSITLGIGIEHDTATPELIASAEVLQFIGDIRSDIGYIVPQTIVPEEKLEKLIEVVGLALRREGLVGFFGVDLVVFTNEADIQELWIVDLDPHYTDLHAFADWIKFCLRSGDPCKSLRSTVRNINGENVRKSQKNLKEVKEKLQSNIIRYSIASGKLSSNGLSKYSHSTLIKLCKDRHVYYDVTELRGCTLCPIDPDCRAISLVSIYPTRKLAIRKFVEALTVLHELSIDKHKSRKTNILKLARELSRKELNENYSST